ncbi:MAG: YhgE/Pip domain-containing protein [Actinomycetota bacterium]|nr:YhgE/Pip domain-containing protein [Actinomycetota bacterium]
MIAGLALGSDNKRYFRGNLPRLAIITIILMPLLYGAMYLWAFWNPFNEVDKIPAAIVNLDEGAKEKGKPFHAGNQVVTNLIDSGQLGIEETSEEDASQGLSNGTYYYTITIPSNFSKAIVSPTAKNAMQAELLFDFNDANNYLSSVIGADAAEQVINKVNETIGDKVMDKVLVTVQGAIPKLQEAVSGADQLAAGTAKLNNGVLELQSQLDQVITPALGELESNQLEEFNAKVADVVRQADTLLPLVEQAEGGSLGQAANDAIAFLNSLPDPEAKQVAANLEAAGQTLGGDVTAASQTISTLSGDLRELEQNLHARQDGSLQAQLASIEQELTVKLETLRSGLQQLASGTGQLNSGMDQLQSGLAAGLAKVPNWNRKQLNDLADTLSTPVNLKEDTRNLADTFGTGFAPFFSGLALFIGALVCWMLLTPLQSRPTVAGVSPLRTALLSYLPALIVGSLQATVLFLVVKFALGLEATHPVGMWLFMVLMSAAFLAIIQAFNAVFDIAIGRVVTLALLMVWLISSGGIYPVPTTALPFQIMHPIDPMTYTVNGLRQLTVAESVDSRLWVAIAVLVSIIVVAIAVTSIVARRNRQYTMERLYPSIEV